MMRHSAPSDMGSPSLRSRPCGRGRSALEDTEASEVASQAVPAPGRDGHDGRVAVAHEPLAGVVLEVAEPVPELRLDRLDARQPHRIERAREGRRRRPARDLEDRVVAVRDPLRGARERPAHVLRVHAVGQRERAWLVGGDVTLDPLLGAGDLRADGRLVVLPEVRVPERVVADLVAAAREEPELLAHVRGLVEEPARRVRGRGASGWSSLWCSRIITRPSSLGTGDSALANDASRRTAVRISAATRRSLTWRRAPPWA